MHTNMSRTATSDLEDIRQIVRQGLKGYAARVYLFGSYTHGTANRTSDIDVAILPLEPLPPWVLSTIRDNLEESQILSRVDLVDLSITDAAFRERVLQEGMLWSEPEND